MVKRSLLSSSFFTLACDLLWLKIKIRLESLLQAFVVSSEIWTDTKKQKKIRQDIRMKSYQVFDL